MTFRQRLSGLRAEAGLRQIDLAEKIDISITAYGKLEKGVSMPSYDTLLKLADIFEVSLDYLTGRSDVRKRR